LIKILDLLILEKTKGVNVLDSKIIIPQLGFARDRFDLSICGAIADSCLDSVKVLFFIIKDIGAKPYTAQNLRSKKDFKVSSTGNCICLAGFELGSRTSLLSLDTPKFVKGTNYFAYTHVFSGNIYKQITYGPPKLMNFLKAYYRGIAYTKLKYSR